MRNFFYSIAMVLVLILGLNNKNLAQCDINLGCPEDVFLSVDPPVFDANTLSISFNNVEIGSFACSEANYTSGMVFYIYQLLPDGSRIDQCSVISEAPFNVVGSVAVNFGQTDFCSITIPIGVIDLPPSEGFEACDGALLQAEAVLYVTEQTNIDASNTSIYTQLPSNQYVVLDLGNIDININNEFPGNGQPLTTAKLRDFNSQSDGPQNLTCGQDIELYVEGLSRLANCTPYNDISTGITSELVNEFYFQINGGQPIIIVDENIGAGGQLTGPDPSLNGLCYAGLLNFDAPYVLSFNDLPPDLCDGSTIVFTLKTKDIFTNQTVEDTYTVIYAGGCGTCGSDCTQTINLNAGWNLISLDLSPANKTIQNIFGNPLAGNLEFIAGFNNGALVFDPDLPDFLNTLTEVEDGFGYWVKVANADVLQVGGACLADNFRKPFDAGWNLVAYSPDASQAPEIYFADLIANGDLEFASGFDNGTKTFDPNRPPFLNTFQQMENGFGYWVKVNNPSAKNTNNLTNVFSFITGTSNLPIGERVKVLNEAGETITILEVIRDSYLMTKPIYGDDATTTFKENISIGEKLRFTWNDQIEDFTTTFKGDYGVENVNLEFKLGNFENNLLVKTYPIPAKNIINFEITIKDASDLLVQIFDNKGSLIQSIDKASLVAGKQVINYNIENLADGIYTYQLITDNQFSAGKFNVIR